MRARLSVPQSRAAVWARLIGALAVPVLAIGAIGTRLGFVPAATLIPVLVLGFALGLIATGVALYALAKIWNSGGEGAGAAVAGMIYSLPALALLGGVSAAALVYPRLTDISTDLVDPPAFENPAPLEPENPDEGAEERSALQAASYGDITPRSYPLPIAGVYSAARTLVEDRGWQITADVPPLAAPGSDGRNSAAAPAAEDPAVLKALSAKGEATQSRGEVVRAVPQTDAREPARPDGAMLQAVARTPLFGFADHVVLRIRQEGTGTRLDMRSASGTGMHDLGQNARRIRSFLADLDAALQPIIDAPPPPPAPVEQPAAPPDERDQPVTQ